MVVFDTEVTILCFELHCVSKNVFTSEAIHAYFSGVGGSGRMASQSADLELARERGVRVDPETKGKGIESKKIVVKN